MILHAEHEMNASTFTARVVAGTNADMHSAIVAAICALKGPLHGGANQAAMAMFEEFGAPPGVAEGVRARLEAKKPLYGFGHPLYRAMDPRAPILRRLSEQFADDGEPNYLEIAQAAEREAHEQKGLWPNVDLYSGVLYHYLGIPTDLFIPLFEMSRVAGQAAHVLEQHAGGKIIRPSAEYVGEPPRDYPVAARYGDERLQAGPRRRRRLRDGDRRARPRGRLAPLPRRRHRGARRHVPLRAGLGPARRRELRARAACRRAVRGRRPDGQHAGRPADRDRARSAPSGVSRS